MLFNSYSFILVFLPVTLIVFFALGRLKYGRMALAWLVAASLFFYGWWNPYHIILILCSIVFNYTMGLGLSQIDFTNSFISKKGFLTIGVTANLLLLGYYKYLVSLLDSLDTMLSVGFSTEFEIIIPLAISFFTFQQIAYLVDAYRNQTREKNFLNYCLFVTFFPQLISGPIVHHQEMLPQFAKKDVGKLNLENLAVGISIFTIGLFKKVVLADNMAYFADTVFAGAAAGHPIPLIMAWEGSILFGLQVYFDFSGYADMAIGIGRMFNIHLPINFNSPYKAVNRFDFWRRWNITLGRFMRHHVYLPIAHNKRIPIGSTPALVITIVLGAIWHGAGLTFILWGALQALLLLINHGWRRLRKFLGHNLSASTRFGIAASIFLNFLIARFVGVFFRSQDLQTVKNMLAGLFGFHNNEIGSKLILPFENMPKTFYHFFRVIGDQFLNKTLYRESVSLLWIIIGLTVVWLLPNTNEIMRNYSSTINPIKKRRGQPPPLALTEFLKNFLTFQPNLKWAIIIGTMLIISLTFLTRVRRFVYFQF